MNAHVRRHWPRKARRRYERAIAAIPRSSWSAVDVRVDGERIDVLSGVASPGEVRPAVAPRRRNPLIVAMALAALMSFGGEK